MMGTEFKTESKINSEFVRLNPIKDALIVTALYTDPWYGLNNDANYLQWNVLMASADPLDRLAFKAELRTYFSLSQAQVNEMEVNWNAYYKNNAAIINVLAPAGPGYENIGGIAYWQWCSGFFTLDDSPSEPSVVFSANTVTGYPEISYFKNSYLKDQVSAENWAIFERIHLYANLSDPTANYEHLWNLTNALGEDPDANSFFNIQSLKQFNVLGAAVPNIIKSPELVYGVDFELSAEWAVLT